MLMLQTVKYIQQASRNKFNSLLHTKIKETKFYKLLNNNYKNSFKFVIFSFLILFICGYNGYRFQRITWYSGLNILTDISESTI